MLRLRSALLAKADYLRLLCEAPVRPEKLQAPLQGSASARWALSAERAATLRAPPEWHEAAQGKLDASVGSILGLPKVPPVFLRALIHPSYVAMRHQLDLAMPPEMLYIGRSLLKLHGEVALLLPEQTQRLSPELASTAVVNSAGLGGLVLFRRDFFATASQADIPREVIVAAGTCLVGAVSAIYGPSAAIKLLEKLCPLPRGKQFSTE
jgi:hypothetical protein